jgi:eukaryotic-like serine/threonine-protein kinase
MNSVISRRITPYPDEETAMVGKTISHYEVLEKLGEGTTGNVYKAQDTKRDRLVALKFLPIRQKLSESDKVKLRQDATNASLLTHPCICAFYSLKVEKNDYFVVMEFVDGKSLKSSMPIMNNQVAINFAIGICSAFQEAHTNGILHRNLRCSSIMVNPKRRLKILGFGLANLKDVLKIERPAGTAEDAAYMSPEQIQGGAVDPRSDVFSLGVLFYHMLSDQLPFRGEHEAAMFYSVQNEQTIPIQQYRPDLSPGFVSIIERALEKRPADRYQSVGEMLAELRHLKRASFSISKVFTRPSGDTRRPVTKPFIRFQGKTAGIPWRKMLPMLLAVLALILLAVIVIRALVNP